MSPFSRFLLRLRRHLLRGYELGMFALLLAVAFAALAPMAGAGAGEPQAQCGNIQSSATVMHR